MAKLVNHIIENNQENKTNYRITAEEVAGLIEGNANVLGDRIFWKVIISSQLDADRGDYLLRDSYHIGVKYGVYDHSRLLNTIALGIEPESNELVLGVDQGRWHVAEAIVIARYQLFTQVYFHKTRRAYDYHLKEAMKTILNNEELPDPNIIEDFIVLDDFTVFKLFKNNGENFNCRSILNREHIKLVHSTPETPNELDEKKKEDVKKKLDENGIWYYEDKAENLWYKLNGDDEDNKEIMIINGRDRKARPLSKSSTIVSNMESAKQIRIYVKHNDRTKAEEVLNNVK